MTENETLKTEADALLKRFGDETGVYLSFEDSEKTSEEVLAILRNLAKQHATGQGETPDDALRKFLLGQLSGEKFRDEYGALHLSETDGVYALFLVSFEKKAGEEDRAMLAGLFEPSSVRAVLFLSETKLLLLREMPAESDAETDLLADANLIVSAFSEEAVKTVRIFFDTVVRGAKNLPKSYQNITVAKEIADTFFSTEQVFSYRALGLQKLLFSLPKEACASYLSETVPYLDAKQLDAETRNTIDTFFENGLSISETARKLYLHRNTLVYRLDKFEQKTGLDIRRFDDAILCRIGMLLSELL